MRTVSRNEKEYVIVEGAGFIEELRKRGAEEVSARKTGCVLARPSIPGEIVTTYTKNGNLETEVVGIEGKMILTRCDPSGKPVIDVFGHLNQWQPDRETFERKYEFENMRVSDGFTRPRGEIQRFIRTDRDVVLILPWGENGAPVEQTIDAGGWLNISNPGNIYGIADEEFRETYERCC